MDTLSRIFKGEARVSHYTISYELGIQPHKVADQIKKYHDKISEFGLSTLQRYKLPTGRPQMHWMLNEDQAFFLINLSRNTKKAVALKVKLTHEFGRYRDIALHRTQGKLIRRILTDAIKEFVEYATSNGSKNANRYYSTITKMLYRQLFDVKDIPKDFRDSLTPQKLVSLCFCEDQLCTVIYGGISDKVDYHDIYRLCKERVQALNELVAV